MYTYPQASPHEAYGNVQRDTQHKGEWHKGLKWLVRLRIKLHFLFPGDRMHQALPLLFSICSEVIFTMKRR